MRNIKIISIFYMLAVSMLINAADITSSSSFDVKPIDQTLLLSNVPNFDVQLATVLLRDSNDLINTNSQLIGEAGQLTSSAVINPSTAGSLSQNVNYIVAGQVANNSADNPDQFGMISLQNNFIYVQQFRPATAVYHDQHNLLRCQLAPVSSTSSGQLRNANCVVLKNNALDPNSISLGLSNYAMNEQGLVAAWYQDQATKPLVNKLSLFNALEEGDSGLEVEIKTSGKGRLVAINNNHLLTRAIATIDEQAALITFTKEVIVRFSYAYTVTVPVISYFNDSYIDQSSGAEISVDELMPIAISNAKFPKIILLENTHSDQAGRLFSCQLESSSEASSSVNCVDGLQLIDIPGLWVNNSSRWKLTDQGLLIGNRYESAASFNDVYSDPQAVVIDLNTNQMRTLYQVSNFSDDTYQNWQWLVQDVDSQGNVLVIARSNADFTEVKGFVLENGDRDGDGFANSVETHSLVNTDPDDANSVPTDLDGDGIPDALDDDKDGDGFSNSLETQLNTDASDVNSAPSDIDFDGIPDSIDGDVDNDGFSNEYEVNNGTDPTDSADVPNADQDGDGLNDSIDDDIDGDGVANADDDFPYDANESSDLDNDGLGDNSDLDRDGDGMPNEYEVEVGLNPSFKRDRYSDLDGDSLTNYEEFLAGTNPFKEDSDGDFMPDAWELKYQLNPNSNNNMWNSTHFKDAGGLGDFCEYMYRANPTKLDSDDDGLTDVQEYVIIENATPGGGDSCRKLSDKFYRNDLSKRIQFEGLAVQMNNPDSDGDGLLDGFEYDYNLNPASELQGCIDSDGDGYTNLEEQFGQSNPTSSASIPNITKFAANDCDGDGVANNVDVFPYDRFEVIDSDGDGVGNNKDAFPNNSLETVDTDGDGVGDNSDAFITKKSASVDVDGDTFPDEWNASCYVECLQYTTLALDEFLLDRDNDGVKDDDDAFPDDVTQQLDSDGDGVGDKIDAFFNNAAASVDADKDGLPDAWNTNCNLLCQNASGLTLDIYPNDADNDGLSDECQDPTFVDADSDCMSDAYEITHGLKPNDASDADEDPDVDGATNLQEYVAKSNPKNEDTDGDSMPDGWEIQYGLNPILNDSLLDLDEDELPNFLELLMGTLPNKSDSDNDDLNDHVEIEKSFEQAAIDGIDLSVNFKDHSLWYLDPMNPDTDGDGMKDGFEVLYGLDPSSSIDRNLDKDGDGLTNIVEHDSGSNPNDVNDPIQQLDTDNDGIPDSIDTDDDGDGHPDSQDAFPLDVNEWADFDGDGKGNYSDTDDDNDGMPDSYELEQGFDSLDARDAGHDVDGDGASNYEEYRAGSNPYDVSSVPKESIVPWLIPILMNILN